MIKKIYSYFSNSSNLAILNGVLLAIIIGLNIYFQAFCIPTTWTIITLSICFTNTILYPLLEKTIIAPISSFINGISLFVFTYCAIFLEQMHLYGLILSLVGIGLVIFIPHFFIAQLIWKNVIKPISKVSQYFFSSAVLVCVCIAIYIGHEYKKAIHSIETFEETNYKELDKNFMTEKIIGMHFIYHTRFCEFDGWRPPIHEPILVIGMWLNNRYDPLNVDLKTRLDLYRKFFPENKFKFDCSCGIEYSEDYINDNLWK